MRGPEKPPRPRSPPPAPDERSRASLTFRVRPCRSLPLNSAIAFCASLAELISTKPKPRDCPVARSVMTATDSHVPAWENSASRSLLVVSKERFPTKIFLPISLSLLAPRGGLRILSRLPGREADVERGGVTHKQEDEPSLSPIPRVVQTRDSRRVADQRPPRQQPHLPRRTGPAGRSRREGVVLGQDR